ncbi:MAG: hypothetical protein F4090_02570 [Nitrospira sp. SB0672_bin_25]|nr:hypothetical protein [Nitrospira sp. SB0666_bin_27]MYD75646.1 hypothetical protein [Gammaproteobacteria bacterium]MYJ53790.1 hypothetical protein [Nitrospira sp. SB0672_bin_25]
MIDSIYVNEGANLHDNQYNRFGREKMSTVSQRYKCIVIDPPWDQGKTGKRSVRPNQGANLDYPTMNYDEIAAVPVAKWADDEAFLWLWATNSRSRSSGKPILMQAFELMDTWGFRYYTTLTWNKATGPCPFGPYQITTEHCLFGYRGKCVFPKESLGKMKTAFSARVTKHSEKPSILYDNIRNYFDGPFLDVFARRRHLGFDAWGDQVQEA